MKSNKLTKLKNVFVTYVFLVPLVYFIPTLVNNYLNLSKLPIVMISVGIIVMIMSYLLMPVYGKSASYLESKKSIHP